MEEKELQAVLSKVDEGVKAQFTEMWDKAKEGIMTPGEFADAIKGMASKEDVTKITESIEKNGANIKAMEQSKKTVEETVYEMISKNKEGFEALHAKKRDVELKLNVNPKQLKTTVITSDITASSWTSSTQAINLPGVNEPAHRMTKIASLFSQFSIAKDSGG